MNAGFTFRPMDLAAACAVLSWRYPPPSDLFNLEPADLAVLLDPEYRYWAVEGAGRSPCGFCCFGEDAQVPGGDYQQRWLLDVGYGLHPELVGRGLGRDFVAAVLGHARRTYNMSRFRVTIAGFNERSRRVCRALGFRQTGFFTAPTGLAYLQMVLDEREGA